MAGNFPCIAQQRIPNRQQQSDFRTVRAGNIYEGHEPWRVKELAIGERAGKRPPLPDHLQPVPAESSRLLSAAEVQSHHRRAVQVPAVSYRKKGKVNGDV
ncbi:hypothetical protein [Paenibacillus bouchesdurhonensis]|uniref:hypothetical protein n=1 Tax=Paenibacillus bouchesdurhonensis TaxID=1870990 RepID=UPI0019029626|nr:hypothetical protein [Paenibacillus bouchesdurhonensis]